MWTLKNDHLVGFSGEWPLNNHQIIIIEVNIKLCIFQQMDSKATKDIRMIIQTLQPKLKNDQFVNIKIKHFWPTIFVAQEILEGF